LSANLPLWHVTWRRARLYEETTSFQPRSFAASLILLVAFVCSLSKRNDGCATNCLRNVAHHSKFYWVEGAADPAVLKKGLAAEVDGPAAAVFERLREAPRVLNVTEIKDVVLFIAFAEILLAISRHVLLHGRFSPPRVSPMTPAAIRDFNFATMWNATRVFSAEPADNGQGLACSWQVVEDAALAPRDSIRFGATSPIGY